MIKTDPRLRKEEGKKRNPTDDYRENVSEVPPKLSCNEAVATTSVMPFPPFPGCKDESIPQAPPQTLLSGVQPIIIIDEKRMDLG